LVDGVTTDRRTALRGATAGAAGITVLVLPTAAAAASSSEVQAWSGTLTFSDVTASGFTVSWTGV